MRISVIRTGAVIIGLLLHAIVGCAYLMTPPVGVPAQWGGQFLGLLIFSAALIPVLHLTRFPWLVWLCFCLRMLSGLLILQAMPDYLSIYFLLAVVLIFEGFFTFARWVAFITGSVFLSAIIWQRLANAKTWDYVHQQPVLLSLAIPIAGCLAASIAGFLFRTVLDHYLRTERLAERFRKSSNKLVEANVRLQEDSILAQRESIISERNRISREIHDSVGYALTNLIAVLDYTRELFSFDRNEEAFTKLDGGRELARSALADVRRAVKALRLPVEISLLVAIRELTDTFAKATGIEVSVQHSIPLHFGEKYDAIILSVIQEALANSFRHGQPAHVSINLYLQAYKINFHISDDGVGTGSIIQGCGLTGIRERVEELNGNLALDSSPGKGFSIQIWLPWRDDKWNRSVS